MSQSNQPLNDFDQATVAQWRSAVERAGTSPQSLTRANGAELPVSPLYGADDLPSSGAHRPAVGEAPFVRGTGPGGWRVEYEYTHANPSRVSASIADDLQRGLQAPWVRLDPAIRRGGPTQETLDVREVGTMVATLPAIRALVGRLDLAQTPLFVEAGITALPFLVGLSMVMKERGLDPAILRGGILADPLAVLAELGGLAIPLERAFAGIADSVVWAAEHAPQLAVVEVSTVPWHDAGAHAVEEVAVALATGVEYLRVLDRYGLDFPVILPRMLFRFAIGNDPFLEMAKLRAARMLWSGVIKGAGGDGSLLHMRQTVRTSDRTGSALDAWNDLVRGTVHTFAAACAGVEGVTTRAFDRARGEPSELGRRMALNTQLILREESHLHRVADPGGGSFYLEALTDAVARSAWALVQEVESNGGMTAMLRDGTLQQKLAERQLAVAADVREGRQGIVGANLFVSPQSRDTGATPVDRRFEVSAALDRRRTESVQRDLAERLEAVEESLGHSAAHRAAAIGDALASGADMSDVLEALVDGGARILVPPLGRQRDAEVVENQEGRSS